MRLLPVVPYDIGLDVGDAIFTRLPTQSGGRTIPASCHRFVASFILTITTLSWLCPPVVVCARRDPDRTALCCRWILDQLLRQVEDVVQSHIPSLALGVDSDGAGVDGVIVVEAGPE